MADSTRRVLSEQERRQIRDWLENWRIAGPLLEAERAARLAALAPEEAVVAALDLWRLARPGAGDAAEGLLELKRLERSARP